MTAQHPDPTAASLRPPSRRRDAMAAGTVGGAETLTAPQQPSDLPGRCQSIGQTLRLVSLLGLVIFPVGQVVAAELDHSDPLPDAAARLLSLHCLECHSGSAPEGQLDLSRRAGAMRGGESGGSSLLPGDADRSKIWARVDEGSMPPEGAQPLTQQETDLLRQWILAGAEYPVPTIDRFAYSSAQRAGYDWWALQPVQRPTIPNGNSSWGNNAIDAFVIARLQQSGLDPSPPTDPRTLLRRLCFDLIGLPPTPAQIESFLADSSEAAYRRLVDELLQSTHYGERWGRHWLDVARFGESDGFERNMPRENQWHFRDWVIAAFNADMPYDAFARQQIAGDLLTPGKSGLASVGFLTAGVHNTVVGSSDFMKKTARQDELEEMAGAVAQTFVGLTVNCARCHDHKFDPISQTEYYQFVASIGGVFHGELDYEDPLLVDQATAVRGQLSKLQQQIAAIDRPIRQQILERRKQPGAPKPSLPAPRLSWDFDSSFQDDSGFVTTAPVGSARIEAGALLIEDAESYAETTVLPWEIGAKTLEVVVQLNDLEQRGGGAISLQTPDGAVFDAIVFGERAAGQWMAGSNSFIRSQNFAGGLEQEAVEQPVHIAIVYQADGTIQRYRNGEPYGVNYKTSLQHFGAGEAVLRFGIRHLPAGGNRHLRGRIYQARFYDRPLSQDEVAAIAGDVSDYVAPAKILAAMDRQQAAQRAALVRRAAETDQRYRALDSSSRGKIYSVKSRTAPGITKVLRRGNAMDEADPVRPGAIHAVKGVSADFQLAPDSSDADRRRQLAQWIASPANPLLARVIVNRVWHYHFGLGIVETPSDFGFNGGRPSHPQLLDWLASELRDNDWSLKQIHRRIVHSATYRQASRPRDEAIAVDTGNRLLWRKSPQRLDAESLRDAMLQVSGELNRKPFGPGFRDVKVEYVDGTTYYLPIDEDEPEFNRRTVYRFSPRGARSAILDTFDCPDPATAAPRRTVTTTPLQALSLLNNPFAMRIGQHFADRILAHSRAPADQVQFAYQLALARLPDAEERERSTALLREHGAAALTRVLFNSNEFITIE